MGLFSRKSKEDQLLDQVFDLKFQSKQFEKLAQKVSNQYLL